MILEQGVSVLCFGIRCVGIYMGLRHQGALTGHCDIKMYLQFIVISGGTYSSL